MLADASPLGERNPGLRGRWAGAPGARGHNPLPLGRRVPSLPAPPTPRLP